MIYHIDDYRFPLIGQAAEDALSRAIADRYDCTVRASNFADGFVIHDCRSPRRIRKRPEGLFVFIGIS